MTIEIPDPEEQTQALFRLLFWLHDEFPGEWCLIGGYMVYLLAQEAGLPFRQTTDADVMADPVPGLLGRITRRLIDDYGMEPEESVTGKRYRFRTLDTPTLTVDLLATEKTGRSVDLRTDPPGTTIPVPGGRQAFNSARTVEVRVGDVIGSVALPGLRGAIRLKLEALELSGGEGDPERHLEDLALLLALIDDPIEFRNQLKVKYRRRLARTTLAERSADCWSRLAPDLADKGHTALMILSPDNDV